MTIIHMEGVVLWEQLSAGVQYSLTITALLLNTNMKGCGYSGLLTVFPELTLAVHRITILQHRPCFSTFPAPLMPATNITELTPPKLQHYGTI